MEFEWAAEDLSFRKDLKAFLDDELPEYHEIFDLPPEERTEFSLAHPRLAQGVRRSREVGMAAVDHQRRNDRPR
jgi:hypothetical protein